MLFLVKLLAYSINDVTQPKNTDRYDLLHIFTKSSATEKNSFPTRMVTLVHKLKQRLSIKQIYSDSLMCTIFICILSSM